MKKALFFLFAAALTTFASCKKAEPRACYSCLNIATFSPGGGATGNAVSDTLREELCDQTESSIRDYERRNSSTANLNAGGAQIIQAKTTTCTRK